MYLKPVQTGKSLPEFTFSHEDNCPLIRSVSCEVAGKCDEKRNRMSKILYIKSFDKKIFVPVSFRMNLNPVRTNKDMSKALNNLKIKPVI